MTTDENATGAGYVDIYLLPVPEAKIEAYRDQANAFGEVAREHGALRYREFREDDLDGSLSAADGSLLMSAVVEFTSRAHRDEVMGKVMADPRVKELQEIAETADMSKMRTGGFQTFVDP